MILANYINDLLYRYDCVIVPNFGGFITNRKGATLNESNHTFYPPSKQITFNSHLKGSDGLLANYIASSENISFEKASDAIRLSVIEWQNQLETKPLEIGTIGVLTLNENHQILFEPNHKVNYLSESFGLSNVDASLITRKETIVKPLVPIKEKETKKGIPTFIKYAATAAILLTLGSLGWKGYQEQQQKYVLQQEKLQNKIQSATFIIENPLPTIELKVTKEVNKPYHVVAGSFQFEENATKKVNQLKGKGYKAYILGKNKWGLTQVAYDSYADKYEAYKSLNAVRKVDSKDAWLLIKQLK